MLPKLTPENIETGHLQKEDFAALGFQVHIYNLYDLPYSEALMRGEKLSPEKIEERKEALLDKAFDDGVAYPEGITPAAAFARAAQSTTLAPHVERAPLLSTLPSIDQTQHFLTIAQDGFRAAHDEDSALWHKLRQPDGGVSNFVIPGTLGEDFPDIELNHTYEACLFHIRNAQDCLLWSLCTKIPAAALEYVPPSRWLTLAIDSHERRHIQQIEPQFTSPMLRFYAELDAEMASYETLGQAPYGQQAIEACRHARYLGMLSNDDSYWFAPTLDALTQRSDDIPTFANVNRAVEEIKIRFALSKTHDRNYYLPSSKLHHLLCDKKDVKKALLTSGESIISACLSRNPAPLFMAMRHMLDKGAATNKLTREIAENIVAAAEYFNPDLVNAHQPEARKRLNERLSAYPLPEPV